MELLDARRYTGPNLVWEHPGAVLDIACTAQQADRLVPRWRAHARKLLDALGWNTHDTAVHRFDNGVSLALSAPLDALYVAVELAESAWRSTVAELGGEPGGDERTSFAAEVTRLREEFATERNPALLRLGDAANEHGVTFLSDDDEVSVGMGSGAQVWPVTALPAPGDVDWPGRHNIPVGLVTGTNGKTTSVRLLAHIVRAAGLNVGLSSTDWVGVNDEVIDHGDYSGPGGARTVLRDPRVDVAVLETARGGLLRRGLGVRRADAVLITNIAEDHLGDFGSRNIEELLEVKWVVTRALDENSRAVLNADDPLLVARAANLRHPVVWFALKEANTVLHAHVAGGGAALTVRDGEIVSFDGDHWRTLCRVADIPLTLGGAARHNVANALGAAGLALALGLKDDAIEAGLTGMTNAQNPGRCNLFDIDGVEVLLDFAHNPQGMQAIFDLAAQRPARRRILAFGQAGDRTDGSIRELARIAWQTGLEHVIVSELAQYHRGRHAGEVYGLLRAELLQCGARPEQVSHNLQEMDSLREALSRAQPGDLVIMLALGDARNILAYLEDAAGA